MRVWDLHCHFSGVEGRTVVERTARLIEFADRMQIERLVFFMGWPWSTNPGPEDLKRQNDQVLEALQHWRDRLLGLCYVSPLHVDSSLREIERCIENGPMVGIKLWVAGRCAPERIDPIIESCRRLKALIYQHTWIKTTGNLEGESTPHDLVELAHRYPQVPMICGHAGGNWELGIRTIRASPNLYLGTGGFDPTAGVIEMAVRELGAERVLYGSDIGGRSFASQLAKVTGADLSLKQREWILGGNLRRLLRPILAEKDRRT